MRGNYITKKQIYDGFNEYEGRVRLYRKEMEAIIGALASIRMLAHCVPDLKRVASLDKKTWAKIRGGYALLCKGLVEYTTKMSIQQYKTIRQNEGTIAFTIAPNHSKYCMDQVDYYKLVNASRAGICAHCMDCTDKYKWRKCPLYQTLDCVPSMEGTFERVMYNMDWCPFTVVDPDEFKKGAE